MRTSFARFVKDESGATAIEYGLIAAGIAVAIITAVNAVGTDLSGLFRRVSAALQWPASKRIRLRLGPAPRQRRSWTRCFKRASSARTCRGDVLPQHSAPNPP
jgi:pilus assembly protein Flp/PilA